MRTRIKICCIANEAEMHLAVEGGVDAVGLVSAMPSGPGMIAEEQIAQIVTRIPPPVASFLLTSQQDADAIIAQQQHTRADTLQLVDSIPCEDYARLRDALPGITLVQVIHVTGPSSVEEAVHIAPHVNAILLDSGNPSLAVKELGGTGRVHNWDISHQIRDAVNVPVFLAGGLNADNVAQAIASVRPFGVDVCSGVRTNGALDREKLTRFCAAVRLVLL